MIHWLSRGACSVVVVEISGLAKSCPEGVDVPPRWISTVEWAEAALLRHRGRRWEWLAGRLAARLALSGNSELALLPGDWGELVIQTRNRAGLGTPPRVSLRGNRWRGFLSISHAATLAAAATSRWPVGIDLGACKEGAQHAPFHAWHPSMPTHDIRLWTAIEAAFKSFGGERSFIPAEWSVSPCTHHQTRFEIVGLPEPGAGGIWRRAGGHCLALCGTRQTVAAFEEGGSAWRSRRLSAPAVMPPQLSR